MEVSTERPIPGATVFLDGIALRWVVRANDVTGEVDVVDVEASRVAMRNDPPSPQAVVRTLRGSVVITPPERSY